jgi:hypothetical protein
VFKIVFQTDPTDSLPNFLLGQRIRDSEKGLRELTWRIDFARDFVEFTRTADFRFVDMSAPPFDRFRFALKFSRRENSLSSASTPHLPLHFISQSREPISLEGPHDREASLFHAAAEESLGLCNVRAA